MHTQTHKQVLCGLVIAIALSGQTGSAGTAPTPEQLQKNRETAKTQFQAWQESLLKDRQEIARKQLRLFHENMKVPPPMPPSSGEADPGLTMDDPPMTRIDIPLPLPTDTQLTMWRGSPSGTIQIGGEGRLMSFVGGSYYAGATYSAEDNKWVAGDAADFRLGVDMSEKTAITGTYQLHASRWTPLGQQHPESKPYGLEYGVDLWKVKGSAGYNTNSEVSMGLGYDFVKTPEATDWLAKASVGVQGQVSMPVKVGGLTRGKRTLSSAMADQVAKLVKYMTEPVSCPHCDAKGDLDCGTCKNTRTITCTQCQGELQFKCTRCEGGGELYCGICKGTMLMPCRSCNGSGQLRCGACGGSGTTTVYETETQSRQVRKLLNVGFDANGQPFEEWGWETEYYTVQVPRQQNCGTCGGNGQGGTCGSCGGDGKVTCDQCGGDGTVPCTRCGGDGLVPCGKCHGRGTITCPDCHGKQIRCPVCKGKKQLGK